jgi:GWxTD domain-containing protein
VKTNTVTLFVSVLLIAAVAAADLPADWNDYFEGPAGFLLTKKEKKAWKKTKTAEAAEQFVELFWAKRDPDLETPLNEFKQDFDLRVAAADEAFGHGSTRGALSDRGRALILLGKPARRIEREPDETSQPDDISSPGLPGGSSIAGAPGDPGIGDPSASPDGPPVNDPPQDSDFGREQRRGGTIEIWAYDPRTVPVKVGQRSLIVAFQESTPGRGDFVFNASLPANATARRVFSSASEALLRHPNLTQVPRYGLIQGTQPASPDQLAWFDAGDKPWPDGAEILAHEGLVSGPRHFIWAHVHLPAGAPEEATAVGRLVNTDSGDEAGSFELPVEGLDLEGGRGYALSVPVGKGRWTLDLALAAEDEPLAVATVTVATTDVPLEGTVFGSFLWGTDVRETKDAKLGDPFNIGGWYVIPRFSSTVITSDEINYMVYVLQPELDQAGQPGLNVTLSLFQDGKRIARGAPQSAQLGQVAPDMWMFGGAITLERFKEPGKFALEVELKQVSDGLEKVAKIPFVIAEIAAGE